eukprot:Sspe_Gene.65684::Locus_38851_Transcript_1_1_Confidence_1.000_Length_1326::g.65684::m.65684
MFPINQQQAGAVLWGRYDGDHYAGGNPWVLAVCVKAELFYRTAQQVLLEGDEKAATTAGAWSAVLKDYDTSSATAASLAAKLARSGDDLLHRLHDIVEKFQFHLPEQLDKSTGALVSATDLTWSYATLFRAMHHRAKYVKML